MGLGWTLSQSDDRAGAIAALRDVVARSQAQDQKSVQVMNGQRSLTEEAARYLIPLLNPVADRAEIARLAVRRERARAPAASGHADRGSLANNLTAYDIAADDASVAFDLDGSAFPQRWTWIRPNAAWLVFDKRRHGIDHVRFAALRQCDVLALLGKRLRRAPVTRRRRRRPDCGQRTGGRRALAGSERQWAERARRSAAGGGVRGLWRSRVRTSATRSTLDEIAFSPRGVTFKDGKTRATFDVVRDRAGWVSR